MKSRNLVIDFSDDADTIQASVADLPSPTRLLPVVARMSRAPELRSRFSNFLQGGTSLGQYLRSINRIMSASTP